MKKITQFLFAVLLIAPTLLFAQAPIAEFSASDTAICGSDTVNFTDLTIYYPNTWKWYFPGGTPDTSTLRNPPPVFYNSPGHYSVSLVVKNGSGSDSITKTNYIHVYSPPQAYFTGPSDLCQGSQAFLSAYGGTKYHWSTGETTSSITITATATTTYTVEVANGPCFKDTSFTVHVDSMLQFKLIGDTSICMGDTSTIYVSPGKGYTYIWNNGFTGDSVIATGPNSTVYYLTLTNGACAFDSIRIYARFHACTNGVDNYSDLSNIDIFPNPAGKQLHVSSKSITAENTALSILDITGRTLLSEKANLSESQLTIDVSSLSPGIYFIKFQTDEGLLVRKFVKE